MTPADAKWFNCVPPQAIVNGAAFTSNVIDTRDFEYLEIAALIGAIDAAMTVFRVQEADAKTSDTALTSGANVTGLIAGTSVNSDGSTSHLPAATDDNTVQLFNIDLKGRKRYLQFQATIDTGSNGGYLAVLARLGRAAVTPRLAAGFGADQVFQAPAYGT